MSTGQGAGQQDVESEEDSPKRGHCKSHGEHETYGMATEDRGSSVEHPIATEAGPHPELLLA